jgi:hypothetical protein
LNVDINHIGVQQMTNTTRPAALLFAAAMFALLWVPTLAMPVQAAVTAIPLVELA